MLYCAAAAIHWANKRDVTLRHFDIICDVNYPNGVKYIKHGFENQSRTIFRHTSPIEPMIKNVLYCAAIHWANKRDVILRHFDIICDVNYSDGVNC